MLKGVVTTVIAACSLCPSATVKCLLKLGSIR